MKMQIENAVFKIMFPASAGSTIPLFCNFQFIANTICTENAIFKIVLPAQAGSTISTFFNFHDMAIDMHIEFVCISSVSEPLLEGFGVVLYCPWAVLASTFRQLGSTWGQLGANFGQLGSTCG